MTLDTEAEPDEVDEAAESPRRGGITAIAVGIAVVVLVVLGTLVAVRRTADDPAGDQVAGAELRPGQVAGRGDPLPALVLQGHGGAAVDLSELAGRPAVINFFASWCASCVAEMPQFEAVHRSLGDEVAFLGVAATDSLEDELDLIERTGVTYDTARDPKGDVMNALGVLALPSTILVDEDGSIAEYHIGELDADELQSLIDEHLLP